MSDKERRHDPPAGEGFPGIDGLSETSSDSPLNRLAAAARRISAVAVGQPLDEADVMEAAFELTVLADRLEAAAAVERRTRNQPTPDVHPQDVF